MRLALRGRGLIESLALRVGLVPVPAAEAWAGMALSGVLVAATQVGLTARLARGACTAAEAAADLDLDPTATQLLLDCLWSARHAIRRAGRYELTRSSRRWLDPDSELSLARFVTGTADYWTWWANLPDVVATGRPARHHDAAPDDPYWRRYVTGQYELARLSAAQVAAKVRIPAGPATLLDVGGAHGWYAAELCRRHPQLRATVLDLPGSTRIGREIIRDAGLSDRVQHRDGDALTADLGVGHATVLCFNLIHHLSPDQVVRLLTKIHSALAPGGSIAVLDAFAVPSRRRPEAAATLGMFVYLSSGARSYSTADLHGWLTAAGFATPRRVPIRRIPGLALYQADRDGENSP